MRREVVELIEAARGLEVQLSPTQKNPRGIRIGVRKEVFPDRLYRVAVALAAVDRAGARALDGTADPSMDSARLRMAIDGVFRWMKASGMSVAEPHAIVAAALGVQPSAGKKLKPMPQYAAMGKMSKGGGKPLLKLIPQPGERITMEALRQKAMQAQMTEVSLGPAAPRGR